MLKKITLSFIFATLVQTAWAETIWLDVRSSSEYSAGHIEGAIHLPHTNVSKQAHLLLPNKEDEILVYCRSGGRAGKAKQALKALGYHNVKNIGGLNDAKKLIDN